MLRDAVDPQNGSDELIRRFYTRWFAIDMSVRDLFPPDMDTQRTAFAQALTWLFSELIAQRAEEPVAFLAQLGRDHRKYGVTQRQYDSMHNAMFTTLRSHLNESWDDKLAEAARDAVDLIVGVMRGAADAEKGPPYCDGTVIEHLRVSRDVSVVRLQLDRPMVAGSTGLAPLRALIMDLTRWGVNPRVHLFFGARYPCELYDLRSLWQIASQNPWLSVTPVSEYSTDPPWAAEYPDVQPPRGLHVRQTGTLPEVVTRYGSWGDRQILVCGGPEMVEATKAALIAKGAPADRIQHDPLAS